jgi:hypothetical protein
VGPTFRGQEVQDEKKSRNQIFKCYLDKLLAKKNLMIKTATKQSLAHVSAPSSHTISSHKILSLLRTVQHPSLTKRSRLDTHVNAPVHVLQWTCLQRNPSSLRATVHTGPPLVQLFKKIYIFLREHVPPFLERLTTACVWSRGSCYNGQWSICLVLFYKLRTHRDRNKRNAPACAQAARRNTLCTSI